MKKKITLVLCCIAILISGIAQPKMPNFHEQFNKESLFRQFDGSLTMEKENSFFPPKTNTQHQKGDWYEPDTIYVYKLEYPMDNNRIISSYENGNISVSLQQFLVFGQWTNSWKAIYSYNPQNKRSEVLFQQWESGQWQNSGRHSYTYNPQNKITEELREDWGSNQWENSYRYSYNYDEPNKTESVFQQWESSQWINISKAIETNDLQNNFTEHLMQTWESNEWVNSFKVTYTYNTQNQFSGYLYQRWHDGQWKDESRTLYTYNPQNFLSEILSQYWDSEQWISSGKTTFSYNTQNKISEELLQTWYQELGYWVDISKNTYLYDNQNNYSEIIYHTTNAGEWVIDGKTTYNFDENQNATSSFYQKWENNTWVNADIDWSATIRMYYNNMRSIYWAYGPVHRVEMSYVKTGTVSITENSNVENFVKFYPNPVFDILHIETDNLNEIPEVKIYSIQGALLLNTKGIQIDVSSLSNGVYIVEINGVSRKIVKK